MQVDTDRTPIPEVKGHCDSSRGSYVYCTDPPVEEFFRTVYSEKIKRTPPPGEPADVTWQIARRRAYKRWYCEYAAEMRALWELPFPWSTPRDPMILEARIPRTGTVNRFICPGARGGAP